ncbi:hypothetical protein ISN75_19875 [Dyella marensis]|uniref:DUF6572 domain-containing protein n=1 Tax=Dyella marensis TaxID=500610 RepID=UPI0031DAC7E5
MTIEDDRVVDSLGISKLDRKVVLLISDHLDWEDEEGHVRLFERKISCYLDFIRSGQIFESLPGAVGFPVRIELVQQYKPSESALRILNAAKQQLGEMRYEFSFHPLPAGYRRPS